MNRTNSFSLASGVLTVIIVSYGASRPEQTAAPGGPVLTVPAGFTIERVAGPPLVNRPIVADFDEEGRLYVADSWGRTTRLTSRSSIARIESCVSRTPTATAASTRASSLPTE